MPQVVRATRCLCSTGLGDEPARRSVLGTDQRFEPTSTADDIVWADGLLQDRVYATIADLRHPTRT